MTSSERLLKSISLNSILHWISVERNEYKKESFRLLKSEKMKFDNPKMKELVRVVDDTELDKYMVNDFVPYNKRIHNFLETENYEMERSYVEYDNRYRQLVCNAILKTEGSDGQPIYGFLRRNSQYTEKSLIGTIGMVGGHVNNVDNTLYSGLIREVSEELKGISFEDILINPLGYIREKTGKIGDQHLCVLYRISVDPSIYTRIKSKETQESLVWMSKDQLLNQIQCNQRDSNLDSWLHKAMSLLL